MINVSLETVKTDLDGVLARVVQSSEPVVVKTATGDEIVLMPMTEFSALQETAYLLSSPANAARLHQSMEQYRRGEVREHELDEQ